MKGRAVARRYAKALIDLAARDDIVADIGEQLQQHRHLFQANAELQKVLWHPGIAAEVKTNLLLGILERTQAVPLLRNFILLLQDKDRLRQFDLICEHYEQMANARLRRVVAQVTTAVELDADQQQAVAQKLEEVTQQDVLLETRLDPSILGGLIVRINHTVLDGSLRGQLGRLRQELIGGGPNVAEITAAEISEIPTMKPREARPELNQFCPSNRQGSFTRWEGRSYSFAGGSSLTLARFGSRRSFSREESFLQFQHSISISLAVPAAHPDRSMRVSLYRG